MFKQRKSFIWMSIGGVILLAAGVLGLQYTTNFHPVMGQAALLPTPQGVMTLSEQGYATPTPDAHRQMHASLLASPDPAATHLGDMTLDPSLAEQTSTTEEQPDVRLENEVYTNDRGGASSIDRLFVTDPTTGQEIRLGDDRGNAHRVAVSMSFIVWNFRCDCPDDGIHIYTFDDHQDTLFASRSDFYAITTEGVWIIYVKPGKGNVSNTMLAYNVETTEQLTMDEDASLYLCFASCEKDNIPPHPDQAAPIRQITFNGTAFFWISNDQHIEQYDLTTRTHTAHPVPAYAWERPIDISASDKTVVWHSEAGYWGYDLLNQQLFAINANPPGWEDIGGSTNISLMKNDQIRIYRGVDGQKFTFTAPIIRP